MINRRTFLGIAQALGLGAAMPGLYTRCSGERGYRGSIVGANAQLGHRLRTGDFGKVSSSAEADIVIVGGGVAALSAARYLKKYTNNFMVLEMADVVGGNSIAGQNAAGPFPWGAHYLPIPGTGDPELINFLHDANVITGFTNGVPSYNEFYLCHDPKERLFINHYWQEGLVPHEGIAKEDRSEIQRFHEIMHDYKTRKGADGMRAFSIPVDTSSRDPDLLHLDTITAEAFLDQHDFKSPFLRWYVNYCCADDFGSSIATTSAWAMVHYFASRNGQATNAPSDAVLTWPEGNYWLVKELKRSVESHVVNHALVYEVQRTASSVTCTYFDAASNTSKQVRARTVILCTPQFINQRILKVDDNRNVDFSRFEYAPWMVANIVTSHPLNGQKGEPLCWDNVIYGSNALGYVNASHQQLSRPGNLKTITYYKPLLNADLAATRRQTHSKTIQEWHQEIISDLSIPHPDISRHIEEINVWLWGHGMIRPSVNFIWNQNRLQAQKSIDNRIFFAHSDLSGISIFEEAFYQGHRAAKEVLS